MSKLPTQAGSFEAALHEAATVLVAQPSRAAELAQDLLEAHPGHPQTTLILGIARRLAGGLDEALQILEPLARAQPGWAPAPYELGVTLGVAGRRKEAVEWLRRAVQVQADIGDAWRLIADHLVILGDPAGADAAYANSLTVSTRDPRLAAPATALLNGRVGEAEALLRDHLTRHPTDVVALRMQADVAVRLRRSAVAEQLLAYCLDLAPDYTAARHAYAVVLDRQNKTAEALAQVERLLAVEPRNPSFRNLKAAALTRVGEHAQAAEVYAGILAEYPDNANVWVSYGHALRTIGRRDASIAAYRRAVELAPGLGEAYWALANIKTLRFSPQDIAAMRAQLDRSDMADKDRVHFRFALGKALEDADEYAESFEQYAEGNRLHRTGNPYDAEQASALVRRSKVTFTPGFFMDRRGWGAAQPDPIFIVGLPRSGSTLVEQILASHSAVEGTMELQNVTAIVWSLRGHSKEAPRPGYPELLAQLSTDELRELGERYLAQTRVYRKTPAPFFIDKMPNNWEHTGLIHLMLPNAKIIDVRRHPMGCCFSCFKQHFASGQAFAYGLRDIGRYYRDYAELMAHLDTVLPGRVHRVDYAVLVGDTEAEIRRLLGYCGLPFEEACLRFYENDRAVRTPSSEQVRSAIYRDALEQWRHYEPWLEPLTQALGPLANKKERAEARSQFGQKD